MHTSKAPFWCVMGTAVAFAAAACADEKGASEPQSGGAAGQDASVGAGGSAGAASVGSGGVGTSGGSASGGSGTAGASSGGAPGAGGFVPVAPTCGAPDAGQSTDAAALAPVEAGLKLAFFGDQGTGAEPTALVELIKAEEADFVLHLGDFDYGDDPAAWEQIMSGFGDLPWFAVVGNHDTDAWTAPSGGYAAVIQRKMDAMAGLAGLSCVGIPGVQHACTFRGVQFVLSGIGLMGSGHESFIRQNLGASDSVWRVCGWHLNQNDMQLGGKGDETGWAVHQECQAEGAMIVNGHEHSYGRTLGLRNIGNRAAAHGAWGDWDDIWLGINRTLLIVNGAGGESLRAYGAAAHDDDTWWSSGYTSSVEIQDGVRTPAALAGLAGGAFIEFGVNGDPALARGYFKTTGGRIVDEWTMRMDTHGLPTGGPGPRAGCSAP